MRTGLNIVPKGFYEITASAGEAQTKTSLNLGSFGYQSKEIPITPQQEAVKVAGQSAGCVMGNFGEQITEGSSYSYKCFGSSMIYKHNFSGNTPKKQSARETPIYQATPYQQGILAFFAKPRGQIGLLYLTSGQSKTISFSTLPRTDVTALEILPIGDTQKFIIVDRDKRQINLFASAADQNPQTVSFPDSSNAVRFSATDKNLYIVSASATTQHGNDSHDAPGKLYILSAENGLQEQRTIELENALDLFDAKVIDGGYIFVGDAGSNMRVYKTTDDSVEFYDELFSVVSSVVVNNKLAYNNGNSIWNYDPLQKTAQLAYQLDDSVSIGQLQRVTNRLAFGVVAGDQTHNFVLTSSPRTSYLDKILGYNKSGTTVFVDYKSGVIYAVLDLRLFTSNHTTGKTVYNKNEINQKKQAFLAALASDGINTNAYKITFYPEN